MSLLFLSIIAVLLPGALFDILALMSMIFVLLSLLLYIIRLALKLRRIMMLLPVDKAEITNTVRKSRIPDSFKDKV